MLGSENSALPGSSAGHPAAPVRLPQSLWTLRVLFDLHCLALYWLFTPS